MVKRVERGRLLSGGDAPPSGERFEPLARLSRTTIEHIVSSAQPDGRVYDQPYDEWVMVLDGAATLEVEWETVGMPGGDWLILPAHTRHRLVGVEAGTTWLAVHVDGSRP